jgi:hypothetical protein
MTQPNAATSPSADECNDWRYAAQRDLLAVFRRYELSVAVGITTEGVMIGSQDERVSASNLGEITVQSR